MRNALPAPRPPYGFRSGRLGPLMCAAAIAVLLGGCQTTGFNDITGSLTSPVATPPAPSDPAALRVYADDLSRRLASRPDDKATALAYAKALKGLTQYAQATAVLQRLAVKHPQDLDVLAAYGKSLADAGRLQEAASVLEHSHTPEHPNWSVLSAQGSVADQLGDHTQAQNYYTAALKIVPNQPQVLSNLGLSYALQRQMPAAEETLRTAAAQPGADMRVRQNLALVLSLEGKYAEAEGVARRDLAPIDAASNVAEIRQMIASSDTWRNMKSPAAPKKVAVRTGTPKAQTAALDLQ